MGMTMSGYVWYAAAGNTFDTIAYAVYGDERYASELISANPTLADKLFFTGGEKVYLPLISAPADADGLAAFSAPWK